MSESNLQTLREWITNYRSAPADATWSAAFSTALEMVKRKIDELEPPIDPLAEALKASAYTDCVDEDEQAARLRSELAKRGLQIVQTEGES